MKKTPLKPGTKPLSRSTPIQRKPIKPAAKKVAKKAKPKGPTVKQYKMWCDQLAGAICRSSGVCARCGSNLYLQWSHRVSRGYLATRWDENNCDAMCRGCHFWQHQKPLENEAWLESRGVDLMAIKRKALTHEKPDYPATLARLVARAEELELDLPLDKFKKWLPSS